MTEQSMFFADGSYYSQTSFAKFIKDIFNSGVVDGIDNELAVSANSPTNMAVQVKTGRSYVRGYIHEILTDAVQLAIADADTTNPRIDRVVLHLDVESDRSVVVKVLTGTPASSPSAPTLTQTDTVWEISLAQVYVGANVTVITSSNITDERTYMWMNRDNMPLASKTEFGSVKVGNGLNVADGVISLGSGFLVNLSDSTLYGPKIGTASYTSVCTPSSTTSSQLTPSTTQTSLFRNLSITRNITTSSQELCYGFNMNQLNIIPKLTLKGLVYKAKADYLQGATATINFYTTDGTLLTTATGSFSVSSESRGSWIEFMSTEVSFGTMWKTLSNINVTVTGSNLYQISSATIYWKFTLEANTNTKSNADVYLTP